MTASQKYTSEIQQFNIVIFGGTGDLSKRKIIPALFQRFIDGQLKVEFEIICINRENRDEKSFKLELIKFIGDEDKEKINEFFKHLVLMNIPKNDLEHYGPIKERLDQTKERQRIFECITYFRKCT